MTTTLATPRQDSFRSKVGFILSASGAAVGLGNIWSFPTQVADHGGAAFILVYLFMIIAIGYPILTLELAIGKHGQSDPIASMRKATNHPLLKRLAIPLTLVGIMVPTLVIMFYNIVSGWVILYLFGNLVALFDPESAQWFFSFSLERNVLGSFIFFLLTIGIIQQGVQEGIEKWSSRMVPALFILFIGMFLFIVTKEGANDGLKHFFIPDMEKTLNWTVWIKAMSQAFFSLTIGTCVLLAYGSYLQNSVNIPKTGAQIALIDTGIALLAGMVVIPAMFVAMQQGIKIYNDDGQLISSANLLFQVLPSLFESLGFQGRLLAIVFFALMTLATLTSSISMLEIPVASIKNYVPCNRQQLTWGIGSLLFCGSAVVCANFDDLFGLLIKVSTERMMPFFALVVSLWGAWILGRTRLLRTMLGHEIPLTRGIRFLLSYVQLICPVIVAVIFYHAVTG
jgi:NSS family neurotransmitter:Na+ symporter